MAKITRASVEALSANGPFSYLWDSTLPGFGARCTAAGVKSYVIRYRHRGRQRIKTLGRTNVLDLSEARTIAQGKLAVLYHGADPFQGHGSITTVKDLATAHQAGRKGELKPKTLASYESLWNRHIIPCMGAVAIDALAAEDCERLRKRLKKHPTTFNRALALLIVALRWKGVSMDGHPFTNADRFKENGRDRILSDDENARLYQSFDEYRAARRAGWRYVDLFALLLLTALRRDEWRLGRWEWINWETGIYTLPDNKTGGRVVYMPQLGIEILRRLWVSQKRPKSGFIFPSTRTKRKPLSWTWRQWDAMRKNLALDGFNIHDMRRTAGSYAHSKAGLNQRRVADLLGHKRMETSARYIHDNEKRETADAAAAAVAKGWQKPAL